MSKPLLWDTCFSGRMMRLNRKRGRRSPLPRTPLSTPSDSGFGDSGTWRIYRPMIDKDKCTKCAICWLYCPENCIKLDSDNTPEVNLAHCKGCGICAKECPIKGIVMKYEGEMKDVAKDNSDW